MKYEPHDSWYESTLDDFVAIAEILGFDVSPRDISFSGFWSQGDGASFTGSYRYAPGSTLRIRDYAPRDSELHAIADSLYEIQRRNFYQLTASIGRRSSHYAHENTCFADVERDSHNYQDATPDAESVIEDARLDLCHWLYSALENEYEYQQQRETGQTLRHEAREVSESGKEWLDQLRALRAITGPDSALREMARTCQRLRATYESARDEWLKNMRDDLNSDVARETYAEGV